MKNQHYPFSTLVLLVLAFATAACKDGFLDEKPSTSIVVPHTLDHYQQLLDYTGLNRPSSLGLLSCDDYYIPAYATWEALSPTERNAYLWNKDLFGGQTERADWNAPYLSVFYANSVLEGLKGLPEASTGSDQQTYRDIKGQAYFVRAFNFFNLATNFAAPYDPEAAQTGLGIPLKLSPNADETVPRSTLAQTYEQILSDLQQAAALLKAEVPAAARNRANKPAAYALFARIYLSMRQYDKAERYADSCLSLYNKLIDYNTISKTSTTPFTATNDENLFWSIQSIGGYSISIYNPSVNMQVDTLLLASYDSHDLRRSIYFVRNSATGLTKVKRGYSGASPHPFTGLATDEVYLIKAECAARRNDPAASMAYLNTLLEKRFERGYPKRYTAESGPAALDLVLKERRKELVWRGGLRWDDIRRLNKEGAGIVLKRVLGGVEYSLPPNDPRYVFPIPDDEIVLSGIQQNQR